MARDSTHLATWVTHETKQRFGALARLQDLSESALLKRLVVLTLHSTGVLNHDVLEPAQRPSRDSRLSLRLHLDDQLLLKKRASARGMASATYVSVLVRAHLRHLHPLPKEELLALKRSVAELNAIGRNLNRIAHAVNRGEQSSSLSREELHGLLTVCEALRDHVKAVIKTNSLSWESGHANSRD